MLSHDVLSSFFFFFVDDELLFLRGSVAGRVVGLGDVGVARRVVPQQPTRSEEAAATSTSRDMASTSASSSTSASLVPCWASSWV